ncbi:MAG: beta-galactosidase, partial [Victivallales bacterium]
MLNKIFMIAMFWSVFLLGGHAAGAVDRLSATPVDQWQVVTKSGDTVTLSEAQGSLCVDSDLNVHEQVLQGHVTFNEATARLLLKKPVRLDDAQCRVIFEAAGVGGKTPMQILPLIRDAEGEILIYTPYPYPHLLGGTENWGQRTTRYFYGAEAGGATQEIFLSEGKGNAWPDGQLEFLGFEIQCRLPKFGRQKQKLYLGEISFGGMMIPYQHPFVYADALVKEAGNYRFSAMATGSFQGPPVKEYSTDFAFNPDSQSDRRRKISIPLGPDGKYWIRYQVTNSDGSVVAAAPLRYNVDDNPDKTPLRPPALSTAPVTGYARINAERHVGGIYAPSEPLAVDVRVFPKGAQTLRLQYRLMPYAYDTEIERGEQSIAFDGAAYCDVTLSLKGESGRDAYRLQVKVLLGDKIVDTQEYVLGRTTDFTRPHETRQGMIRGREYVKQSAYFRTTYTPEPPAKSEKELLQQFSYILDQAVQISPYLTYAIDLANLEILPGVYDFSLLDRIMDAASDRGCTLTVRLGHIDAQATYRWLPYSRQRNYDGTEIHQQYYGCYSGVDPAYMDLWKRANRALYDRYRKHPGFQGYYLMMPSGEWSIIIDQPWLGVVAGYEPVARQAFIAYLRDVAKFTLEQVNARWNTGFKTWEEITPPMPEFRTGVVPDMRVQWLDFCRFKGYINTSYWYLELTRYIRSFDKERVVIIYAPPTMDGLETLVDYTHGGGVPALPGVGECEEIWAKYRVGSIQEPHHPYRWNSYGDPGGRGWVLDWDLFTMISTYGGGGANLHIYYHPNNELPTLYGQEAAYDRYEKFKPVFREMQKIALLPSPGRQVATFQDPASLYCKHRSNFTFRLPDLSRWFELLSYAGVDYEPLDRQRLANYKLVLPNLIDEVVSKESIDLLDGYVRNGGKIIISAVNGRYCPELGKEPFPLLRRLGI